MNRYVVSGMSALMLLMTAPAGGAQPYPYPYGVPEYCYDPNYAGYPCDYPYNAFEFGIYDYPYPYWYDRHHHYGWGYWHGGARGRWGGHWAHHDGHGGGGHGRRH